MLRKRCRATALALFGLLAASATGPRAAQNDSVLRLDLDLPSLFGDTNPKTAWNQRARLCLTFDGNRLLTARIAHVQPSLTHAIWSATVGNTDLSMDDRTVTGSMEIVVASSKYPGDYTIALDGTRDGDTVAGRFVGTVKPAPVTP
jgi:hypothetical protein